MAWEQLAKPAQRALQGKGIETAEDISTFSLFEIEELHGIGKSALDALEKELEERGLWFKTVIIEEVVLYIDYLDEIQKEKLLEMQRILAALLPHASQKMAYGMPIFYHRSNILHFAAFKHHIGLFPLPQTIAALSEELKGYKTSRGAIQFPLERPLPYQLIQSIADYRSKELTGLK